MNEDRLFLQECDCTGDVFMWAAIQENASAERRPRQFQRRYPNISERFRCDISGCIIRIIGDAELGNDARCVRNLGSQNHSLGIMIFAWRTMCVRTGFRRIHHRGANASFRVGFEVFERVGIQQDRTPHAVCLTEKFDNFPCAIDPERIEQTSHQPQSGPACRR